MNLKVLILVSSVFFEGNPQFLRQPSFFPKLEGNLDNVEPYEINSIKGSILGEKQTNLKPQIKSRINNQNAEKPLQASYQNNYPRQRIKYKNNKSHLLDEPTIHIDTENAIIDYERNDTIETQRELVEIESLVIKKSKDETNSLGLLNNEDHYDERIDSDTNDTRRIIGEINNLGTPGYNYEIPHAFQNNQPIEYKNVNAIRGPSISNDNNSDRHFKNEYKEPSSFPLSNDLKDKLENDANSLQNNLPIKYKNVNTIKGPIIPNNNNSDKYENEYIKLLSFPSSIELNDKLEGDGCADNDDNEIAEKTDSEILDETLRKNIPTNGLGITGLVKSRMMLFKHPRVCYACNSIRDKSCWSPNRRTSVKYCRRDHHSCLTKVYQHRGKPQIIRDCGDSCSSYSAVETDVAYASCTVCQTDLCNSADGLPIKIVSIFIVAINIIVGVSKAY